MTEPAEVIGQALTGLANDRRRTANHYVNATARPGSDPVLRRLLSDDGFLEARQFSYFIPNRRNFSYSDTDGPRELKQILLVPYGVAEDVARLTSSRPIDRVVSTIEAVGSSGVVPYPGNPLFLMPATLDAETRSTAKAARLLRAATSRTGPTPHFVINRNGDISVGPSVDAETTFLPDYADNGVFVALESAVAIYREDHAARRYDRLVELPFTDTQLFTLAILVAKLLTATGTAVPRTFNSALTAADAGFAYLRPADSAPIGLISGNFGTAAPTLPWEATNLEYRTADQFFVNVDQQGSFALATDVWRPTEAPRPIAGREAVRTVIGTLDTAGAESVAQGAYATLASGERSNEMQTMARQRLFVMRRRVAHRDADNADEHAAGASSAMNTTQQVERDVRNAEPHTYNFDTGLWLDRGAF